MMQAFPGSFPPDVFDALALDRYAEAYDLAVEVLTAQADAAKKAR
ncbi:hypothetical protein [Roseospira visakhapatnamensis]|uniref:Uncharacterized protein n=1 Tax=Roseospira visakhapatnamensis TaxID=390880 RepID=A0A7W6RHJ0_9PROT|nr:hypothetical protein [Roseospira visakhapatnamensis]MBB4268111.1 hypothetical protein [Roseospira visakhapatnamensis]